MEEISKMNLERLVSSDKLMKECMRKFSSNEGMSEKEYQAIILDLQSKSNNLHLLCQKLVKKNYETENEFMAFKLMKIGNGFVRRHNTNKLVSIALIFQRLR